MIYPIKSSKYGHKDVGRAWEKNDWTKWELQQRENTSTKYESKLKNTIIELKITPEGFNRKLGEEDQWTRKGQWNTHNQSSKKEQMRKVKLA